MNNRVEANVEFASTAFAQELKTLVDEGFVRAASVGFRPIDSTPRPGGGHRITKWELLEWSLVPVPANPEALLLAVKAKGLKVDALRHAWLTPQFISIKGLGRIKATKLADMIGEALTRTIRQALEQITPRR